MLSELIEKFPNFFFLILIRRSKHEFLDLFIIGFFFQSIKRQMSLNKNLKIIPVKLKRPVRIHITLTAFKMDAPLVDAKY